MLRMSSAVLFFLLFLISACKPFLGSDMDNQFTLKQQILLFQGQELSHWQGEQIPHCKHCLLSIYTKKMLPGAMLFKQINNSRGELIFFSASNTRHSFALPTGSATYAITAKREAGRFILSTDQQHSVTMLAGQKTIFALDDESYFVWIQENEDDATALDITFWLINQ